MKDTTPTRKLSRGDIKALFLEIAMDGELTLSNFITFLEVGDNRRVVPAVDQSLGASLELRANSEESPVSDSSKLPGAGAKAGANSAATVSASAAGALPDEGSVYSDDEEKDLPVAVSMGGGSALSPVMTARSNFTAGSARGGVSGVNECCGDEGISIGEEPMSVPVSARSVGTADRQTVTSDMYGDDFEED